MSEVREIVKKIYEDMGLYGIDFSEDSVISKLFINVIEEIYKEYISSNGIPKGIPEVPIRLSDETNIDKLLSICENNRINIYGSEHESEGTISIIFTKKNEFFLPSGSIFYSGENEFLTTENISITESSYCNYAPGLYSLNNIVVSNKNGMIAEKNTIYSKISYKNLYSIFNERITPRTRILGINDIKSIIKSNISNGLKSIIMQKFNSVQVDIVSSGDPLMQRDMMYIAYPYNLNHIKSSNFLGKVRGDEETNKNIAYKVILDKDEIDDEIDIVNLGDEFNQDQYLNINSKVGGYVSISTDDIVNADFNGDENKIGVSSNLISSSSIGADYILVKEPTKFSEGDQIYIRDNTTNKVVSYCVIKAIEERELDITFSGNNTLLISCDITKIVFPRKIIVGKSDSGQFTNIYIKEMTYTNGLTTVTIEPIVPNGITKALIPSLYLYRSLSVDLNPYTKYTIEVPLHDGTSISGSWIKSESGMDIGYYKEETSVIVSNGELAIGNVIENSNDNPISSYIIKYGKSRFAKNILKCLEYDSNLISEEDNNETEESLF